MLMIKERRPARRTIEAWARSVLLEAGAIRECEEPGWMKDRADPHARERAFVIARQEPPPGLSAEGGGRRNRRSSRIDRRHLPGMSARRRIGLR